MAILTSTSLVDPDIPLRHSLQNAFDGGLSTNFVANAEDGLMTIDFSMMNFEGITRIALRNGSAQDLVTCRIYGRLRKVGIVTLDWNEDNSFLIPMISEEIVLSDDEFSYQTFYVISPFQIRVLEIFDTQAYSFPLLGELNLYVDGFGWLFGDIDG